MGVCVCLFVGESKARIVDYSTNDRSWLQWLLTTAGYYFYVCELLKFREGEYIQCVVLPGLIMCTKQ